MEADTRLLAKYPFIKEANEFLKRLNIKTDDLTKPEYQPIIKRALLRVTEAITKLQVTPGSNVEIEVLSFPVSIMLIAATENPFVVRRYALAESQRAYANLKNESNQTLEHITREFWSEAEAHIATPNYQLKYPIYLRNSVAMKHEKWKLANRVVSEGLVYVTRDEFCRLLSEEIRRRIEARTNNIGKVSTPFKEEVKTIIDAMEKHLPPSFKAPESVETEAFPPCIRNLYNAVANGKHLGHSERFALTSFLARVNMPVDQIVTLFSHLSDFNESKTRYQVEHIAGKTGAKTVYKPPNCRKLKTQGICKNPDELCKKTYHPLSYYERKLGLIQKK